MLPFQLVPAANRRALTAAVFAACCLLCVGTGLARGDATDDYNLAIKFFNQERWELAETQCRAFLDTYASHPRVPTVRMLLGQALVNQRKFDEARDVYRTFVAEHDDLPEVALARFRVGEASYFLKEDAAARDELQRYLEMHADHDLAAQAWQYLGDVQLRLKDPRSAGMSFQRVLDKSDDDALREQAKFGLAQASAKLNRTEQAEQLYQQLAQTDGQYADDARFQLGTLYFEQRDYGAAAREFSSLPTAVPGSSLSSVAELNAGYAYYYLSDFEAAIEQFALAENDDQYAATAGFWKGLSYKKIEDYDAAVKALRAIYERDTDQPLAERLLFHIGDSELRRSAYVEAEQALLTVVDRWPESDRADDALHLATESALRRGDLDASELLNARFEREYANSGSQWLQRVLAGRIHLARGDAIREATPESDQTLAEFQAAVAVLQQVLAGSDVPRTQSLARLQLARAYDRLADPEAVARTLEPLISEFEGGKGDPEFADGLLLQAEQLLKLERYEDAARAAQLYLDTGELSGTTTALALQAAAWSKSGDRQQLSRVLDLLINSDEDATTAAVACYEAAEVAYDARQWEWAAELFERAVSLGPETGYHAASLSGLGYSQYEAGRFPQAAETFASVVKDHSQDVVLASTAAHMRALSLRQAGDREAAALAYLEGLQQFAITGNQPPTPDELEAGLNAYRCAKGAARMFRELERVADADAAYKAADEQLQRQPEERRTERDKLISEWALLHYEAEDYERSDELFQVLVRDYPDSDLADDARLYLAESRFFADDLPAARTAFEELKDDPRADDFVRQRSSLLLLDVLADLEEWDALLAASAQFVSRFGESDDRWYAGYRVGEAALELGENTRSIRELTSMLSGAPHDVLSEAEWTPNLYLLLSEAYFREKNYAEVDATIKKFREFAPDSPFLYQADEILGRSYKNRAMFPEAREAFARVTESEKGHHTETAAKAQFHIAETYLIEKNYEAALAEYYKVYVNYPYPEWQAPALFQAGQCDRTLEHWDGAVKSYAALIEEFPESEYARRAEPLLEEARAKAKS